MRYGISVYIKRKIAWKSENLYCHHCWFDKIWAACVLRRLHLRTWNYLRRSQQVKVVQNHWSHPLELHPQQKEPIQLISPPISKTSMHKKFDSIISALDGTQDKIKQYLPTFFSEYFTQKKIKQATSLESKFHDCQISVKIKCQIGKCASIEKVGSILSALNGIYEKIKLCQCLPTTFSRWRRKDMFEVLNQSNAFASKNLKHRHC